MSYKIGTFSSGGIRSTAETQWQPTTQSHDPDPPITLELPPVVALLIPSYENVAQLTVTNSPNFENTYALASTFSFNVENLLQLINSGGLSYENVQNLFTTFAGSWEQLLVVSKISGINWESLLSVILASSKNWENLLSLSTTFIINYEIKTGIGAVVMSALLNYENLSELSSNYTTNTEWNFAIALTKSFSAVYEFLKGLKLNDVVNCEWYVFIFYGTITKNGGKLYLHTELFPDALLPFDISSTSLSELYFVPITNMVAAKLLPEGGIIYILNVANGSGIRFPAQGGVINTPYYG